MHIYFGTIVSVTTENLMKKLDSYKILYIEPFSGVAGDMFAAAILSLLPDEKILLESLKTLPISNEFKVSIQHVEQNGISAKRFIVVTHENLEHHHGRTFDEIASIINGAHGITSNAKNIALKIFTKLAKGESAVHGKNEKHIHFHEVGAIDAIVEICTAAIAIDIIKPNKIVSLPTVHGKGFVKSAHGVLPIPAPATVEILKGCPVEYTNIEIELTTPTGAAILATVTDEWDTHPVGKIINTGYGAGTKTIKERPNALRLTLLESSDCKNNAQTVTVIETNIDDMPGEHLSYIGPKLLKIGAIDYVIIPVTMKKNRQGFIIQAICEPSDAEKVAEFLLKNTSAIGVRYYQTNRVVLDRKSEVIDTELGPVRVKYSYDRNGQLLKAKPEQEDIAKIAEKNKIGYHWTYDIINTQVNKK